MSVEEVLYQCFLFGVPIAIYAAIIGFRWREGLWSNILSFFTVMFSMLFAVGWWEMLAIMLAETVYPGGLFFWDYVAIWVVFIVCLIFLETLARAISRAKIKFPVPVENVGNVVILLLLATTMYLFFLFTYDLSPIGEKSEASPPESPAMLSDAFRALSANNLKSFYCANKFDADGKTNVRHFKRRQAFMESAEKNDGSLFYQDTTIPSRRNR